MNKKHNKSLERILKTLRFFQNRSVQTLNIQNKKMKKFYWILLVIILTFFILLTNAFSEDKVLTLRLVHPDHDRISIVPPSEVKIDKNQYECFAKESVNYWVSRKIELDINDMKNVEIRVITPPSKEEIAELSKKYPNTSFSLEPTYNVTISLNKTGQEKFANVTATNIMRRLAVIFEGNLLIAPLIMEKITSGVVVVSGLSNYNEATKLRETIKNQPLKSK